MLLPFYTSVQGISSRRFNEFKRTQIDSDLAQNGPSNHSGLTAKKNVIMSAASSSSQTASVFEVIFPDQRTLGLHVLPLRLSFTDDDLPTNQVYGCQVTRSSLTDDIQEGDILVSVNGIALLSSTNVPKGETTDPNQTILGAIGAFDTFLQMMKTTFPPRTLRVFRLLRKQLSGFDGGSVFESGTSSNIALTGDETALLFGEIRSPADWCSLVLTDCLLLADTC